MMLRSQLNWSAIHSTLRLMTASRSRDAARSSSRAQAPLSLLAVAVVPAYHRAGHGIDVHGARAGAEKDLVHPLLHGRVVRTQAQALPSLRAPLPQEHPHSP